MIATFSDVNTNQSIGKQIGKQTTLCRCLETLQQGGIDNSASNKQ